MDLRPSRQVMMSRLMTAGVDYPESASLSQLRVLYEREFNTRDNVTTETTNNTDSAETKDGALVLLEAVAHEATNANTEAGILLHATAVDNEATDVNYNTITDNTNATRALSAVPGMLLDTPAAENSNTAVHTAAASTAAAFTAAAAVTTPDVLNTAVKPKSALEEELQNLQLRMEILKLQQEIKALEANERCESYTRRIDLSELDVAVPPLSGDDHYDVTKWFDQFEDYTEMCKYTEKEKCVGLRRRLEGTAKKHAANLGLMEYTQIKSSLMKMFKRSVSRQDVYRQLRARTLKPNESCLSYLVTMQSIAAQSDIEERELVDIIVDGIPDDTLATTFLYSADTIDELVKRMDRYEQRRYLMRPKTTKAANTSTANKLKSTEASVGVAVKATDAEVRCFNCSQFGHYQDRCPKPKRPANSCFICAEVGHFHQNCPRKKKNAAAIVGEADERVDAYQMMKNLWCHC